MKVIQKLSERVFLVEKNGKKYILKETTRKETETYEKVSHPNIINLVEVIDDNKILLEYIEGKTLREVIPLPKDIAFKIFYEVLRGIYYLHSRGIVHGDLKPENIIISFEGFVKICDFSAEQREGTPAYSAPEVIKGEEKTEKSDIFSLGILFYEMLTGRNPFLKDSINDTMRAILEENPPPTKTEFDKIIFKMLQKSPDMRPDTETIFEYLNITPPEKEISEFVFQKTIKIKINNKIKIRKEKLILTAIAIIAAYISINFINDKINNLTNNKNDKINNLTNNKTNNLETENKKEGKVEEAARDEDKRDENKKEDEEKGNEEKREYEVSVGKLGIVGRKEEKVLGIVEMKEEKVKKEEVNGEEKEEKWREGKDKREGENSNKKEDENKKVNISISSIPWGKVFISGKEIGETPILNFQVPKGKYKIKFKRGEIEKTFDIILNGNKKIIYNFGRDELHIEDIENSKIEESNR